MNILYVNTFNEVIWNASGRTMIDSFVKTGSDGKMLVCYEGFKRDPIKTNRPWPESKFITYNLSNSSFLKKWLSDNKDIIPPDMGGEAHIKKKPAAFLPWNMRAAGWFRKIVAMDQAVNDFKDKVDCIIFVDSDCVFLKKIDENLIAKAFGKRHFFYHWGEERPKKGLGIESGFIGFKTTPEGLKVLNEWIDKYKTNSFRRYLAWDDGGMFANIVIECRERYGLEGNDLVTNYNDIGKGQSHVIGRGLFAAHIFHDKGKHKKLGIK